jgi:MFS family permease
VTESLKDRSWSAQMGWFTLIVMTCCYSFAFVDRQILNLLVEPMKRDFGASDVEIGFLLGPAFTLSYTGLGIPAGWCADRFDRRKLVLCAGTLWSLGTMAAAFASTYHELLLSRVMVGASEAFLFPSGMSLIADLFERRRLPLATSIFLLSPYIGGGLALILGGVLLGMTIELPPIAIWPIGSIRGWQMTLALVGALGLLPVLALLFAREPSRTAVLEEHEVDRRYGFLEGLAYMVRRWRFYAMFYLGMAGSSLVLNTVPAWAPTFLVRAFGMNPTAIGLRYGVLVLLFGITAGITAPLLNAWLSRRYADSTMRTVLIGPAVVILFAALLLIVATQSAALACLALITFGYSFPLSMAGTSLQLATPPRLRGTASAFYFVIVGLIGLGLGPMLVPFVSRTLLHDDQRIGEAMAIVAIVFSAIALLLLWLALKGFRIERGLEASARAARIDSQAARNVTP